MDSRRRYKGVLRQHKSSMVNENIPMDKKILRQFIKSGFVFKDKLYPTNEGTPQGGLYHLPWQIQPWMGWKS